MRLERRSHSRNRIELGPAIVFRSTPAGPDPPPMLQSHQGGVDSAFVEFQDVIADLLDAPGDTIPVLRAHAVERLQHHQVERALQHLELWLGICSTFGHRI
jgi:hypothetical protein